jgi:hypothetical protein
MEGSVLSFLKAEWKVSDTGSAHWALFDIYCTPLHALFNVASSLIANKFSQSKYKKIT